MPAVYSLILNASDLLMYTDTPKQLNFITTDIDVVLALGKMDVVSTYQDTPRGYHVTIYKEEKK